MSSHIHSINRTSAHLAIRLTVIIVFISLSLCHVVPMAHADAQPAMLGQAVPEWRCYDDGSLDPCQNRLNSTSFLNISQGWAVGDQGKIFRYAGGGWHNTPSPVTWDINEVQVLAADNAWAVGGTFYLEEGLTILHWNGTVWVEYSDSIPGVPAMDLHSIFMLNGSEGWAAGKGRLLDESNIDNLLLHWNGTQWQQVDMSAFPYSSFTDSQIWASAPNDVWIFSNIVLHWNGAVWSEVTVPGRIQGIHALSADNIWGIGVDDLGASQIFHWNGTEWSAQYKPDLNLTTIAMRSSSQGWVVGYRMTLWGNDPAPAVLTWNGSTWTETALPGKAHMFSIAVPDNTHSWAVGDYGTILKWDGVEWSVAIGGAGPNKIVDLAMVSSTDGWAVGFGGVIKRFNGKNWLDWPSPTTNNLTRIQINASNDIWVMGNDTLLLWNQAASRWDDLSTMFDSSIASSQAIQGGGGFNTLPDFGWKIVTGGLEYRYFDNDTMAWKVSFYPFQHSLYSIYMASAVDGWVTSYDDYGTRTYHWNGAVWEDVPFGDEGLDRPMVYGFGSNDVWIVGERTAHWAGQSWSTWLSEYGRGFYDIDKVGTGDYFAIGYDGLAHWNVSGTTNPVLPVSCTEDSIDMLSTTEGWAVGFDCPLIYYSAPKYQNFLPILMQ